MVLDFIITVRPFSTLVDKVSKSVQTEVQTLSDDQSIPQTAQASTEDTEDNPWIFGIYQRVQEAELKGTERTQSPEEEESNMDAMDNQDTFRSDQSPSYTSQIATSHNTTLRKTATILVSKVKGLSFYYSIPHINM